MFYVKVWLPKKIPKALIITFHQDTKIEKFLFFLITCSNSLSYKMGAHNLIFWPFFTKIIGIQRINKKIIDYKSMTYRLFFTFFQWAP